MSAHLTATSLVIFLFFPHPPAHPAVTAATSTWRTRTHRYRRLLKCQQSVVSYKKLLPCAHQVFRLRTSLVAAAHGGGRQIVLDATVAGMLGLEPPLTTTKQQRQRQPPGEESGREDGRNVVGVAIDEGIHQSSSHEAFDVSVLCTAYADVNALFEPHSRVESRLGGALLWNVNVRCMSLFFRM